MEKKTTNKPSVDDLIKLALVEETPKAITKENIEAENTGLTATKYIENWFKVNKINYNKDGILCMGNNLKQDFEYISNKLITDYGDFKLKYPRHPKFQREELQSAFKLTLEKHRHRLFDAVVKSMKYDSSIDPDFTELRKYLAASNKNYTELDLKVHQQFLLNIKRKLNGIEATHHLFIIYFGPQGTGKTIAIRKLLAPLYHLSAPVNFEALNDRFSHELFRDNYVLFLDELEKAEKMSIERIKNTLSSNTIKTRLPFSSVQVSIANNSSYIGCSNKRLRDTLSDQTGMRRFYEYEIPEKMDWEVIDDIDYLKIWQSIDPKAESFTTALADDLKSHQESLKTKTIYEQFIEDKMLERGNEEVTASRMYEIFMDYCDRNNYRRPSQTIFGTRMGEHFDKIRKKIGQFYLVNYTPTFRDPAIEGFELTQTDKLKMIKGDN